MSSAKIIKYMIASHVDVDRYLNNGWNLYAQPIVRGNDIYQAIVKYKELVPPHLLPIGLPIHPVLDTHPLFVEVNSFEPEEIKQMQDACNELIKVLEGKSTDYQYGGNKSTYVCNMPEKLRNHLKGMGYDFSPVESHRNEEYCYMFLA